MDVENKYVLEEFRNKVAQQLQFQFQEYVEMREAAATVKLAEHLRHLVGEVFKALKKNGINFD